MVREQQNKQSPQSKGASKGLERPIYIISVVFAYVKRFERADDEEQHAHGDPPGCPGPPDHGSLCGGAHRK